MKVEALYRIYVFSFGLIKKHLDLEDLCECS